MSANRYLPAAIQVARTIPKLLLDQGLNPLISRYVLTETDRGDAWLFVVMDDSILDSMKFYAAPNLLSLLSNSFHGHRVFFSHSYGLRYAILLSPARNLPGSG